MAWVAKRNPNYTQTTLRCLLTPATSPTASGCWVLAYSGPPLPLFTLPCQQPLQRIGQWLQGKLYLWVDT